MFAATGGIGHEILVQAVAAGHEVTAAVREPSRLDGTARGPGPGTAVRVVKRDLAAPEPAALRAAVAGADAVLSGLGPRAGRDPFGVTSGGTERIMRAMRERAAAAL